MSAVATKPRARVAKATPKKDHAAEMRDQLREVGRLLDQAWNACEESSTTDTLLQHLVDDLLPDTTMALMAEDLHRGVTSKAYDDLFLPLALLDSIVTINAGQVLHHTLATAHSLLDGVQSGLDNNSWPRDLQAAPVQDDGPGDAAPVPAPTPFHAHAVAAIAAAQVKLAQAAEIMFRHAEHSSSNAVWGTLRMVQWLQKQTEEIRHRQDMGGPSVGALNDLSCHLCEAYSVVEVVMRHEGGDLMLGATHTLLAFADAEVLAANSKELPDA